MTDEDLADTPELAPKADLTRPEAPQTAKQLQIRQMRSTHKYKSAAAKFRKLCAQKGAGCWLCNQPIQYSLKFPHPGSYSTDHSIPAEERPDLFFDTNLWRPAHFSCNSARGGQNDDINGPAALGVPSEIW